MSEAREKREVLGFVRVEGGAFLMGTPDGGSHANRLA